MTRGRCRALVENPLKMVLPSDPGLKRSAESSGVERPIARAFHSEANPAER